MSATPSAASTSPPMLYQLAMPLTRHLPFGRYRLMHWLVRNRPAAPFVTTSGRSANGLRFECDVRIAASREAYFTGQYEPQETCLVRSILRPGQVFVDVGANCGYFSLLAAGIVGPSGRVIAIEAHPKIHGTLTRSLGLNDLPYVTVINAAVADGPGSLPMLDDENATGLGMARISPGAAAGTHVMVRAAALDDLLDDAGADRIDLLKMDIEGAEVLAVRGMTGGLNTGRYRRILLELHPREIGELQGEVGAIYEVLRGSGYTPYSIEHNFKENRRAAYDRHLDAADLLRPFNPDASLGEWPHQLWTAPGVSPFDDAPGEPRN